MMHCVDVSWFGLFVSLCSVSARRRFARRASELCFALLARRWRPGDRLGGLARQVGVRIRTDNSFAPRQRFSRSLLKLSLSVDILHALIFLECYLKGLPSPVQADGKANLKGIPNDRIIKPVRPLLAPVLCDGAIVSEEQDHLSFASVSPK